MNIGNVTQKSFTVGSGENQKVQKYLEMIVRPPFMESATFTISQNKKKQNDNEPDWNIFYSYNRKGEKFRRAKVGAIWDKQKDDLQYKTGHIETPLMPNGRLNITLFKSKQLEGETAAPSWAYDVVWTFYKAEDNNETSSNYNVPAYHDTPTNNVPEIDIDSDEIPF